MKLWDDGRSGAAGCFAGNTALHAIERSEAPIHRLKGTTFESADALIIGRVCATDEYLRDPILHWSNASWDQHVELKARAQKARKELIYLLITASNNPPAVRYWRVPGKIVEAAFIERGKNQPGETCAIHVAVSRGKHVILENDITSYFASVELGRAEARQLRDAFHLRRRGVRTGAAKPGALSVSEGDVATFDIPASGARVIRLQAKLPLSSSDVDRLKRWIDLTADVLTEGPPAQSAERTELNRQIRDGLDALERGDTVDGEAAFDRILKRPRQQRRARK